MLCDKSFLIHMLAMRVSTGTSRMLKLSDNLILLRKCSSLQRKFLLKSANPALIHAICDWNTNIIHQRIHITAKQKGVLAEKKRV